MKNDKESFGTGSWNTPPLGMSILTNLTGCSKIQYLYSVDSYHVCPVHILQVDRVGMNDFNLPEILISCINEDHVDHPDLKQLRYDLSLICYNSHLLQLLNLGW